MRQQVRHLGTRENGATVLEAMRRMFREMTERIVAMQGQLVRITEGIRLEMTRTPQQIAFELQRGPVYHALAGGMPGLVNITYNPQPRYSIAEMTEAQIRKAIEEGDTATLEGLLRIFREKQRRH